jgi:hypothetical protein
MQVSAQLQALAALTLERDRGIPVNRSPEGLRSRPARVREEQILSPSPGLQPRTAQPVP